MTGSFVNALLATFFISLAPVIILFFIPLIKNEKDKTVVNRPLLKALISFAVGGLLGGFFSFLFFFPLFKK